MRRTTLAVCAHVDAGKTTFSEQLLCQSGRLRTAGTVDAGSTTLDYHELEKKRGVTIFADQSVFEIGDLAVYFLDTPGHVDFSSEMERALCAADYALLLVSAPEGVQSHTKTVYARLRQLHIPVFIFLNKMDRLEDSGESSHVLSAQLERLTGLPLVDGNAMLAPDDQFTEILAEQEEELMEAYFSGDKSSSFWQQAAAHLFAVERIVPVFSGSALRGEGVLEWMNALPKWVESDWETRSEAPFAAKVYRMTRDKSGTRWYYLKIESGSLAARDLVETSEGVQKIAEVRECFGAKLTPTARAYAGMLAAVCGITVSVGTVLGNPQFLKSPMPQNQLMPFVKSAVLLDDSLSARQVLSDFKQLCEEEPSLQVGASSQTGQISVCVMGEIQLEVLQSIVRERFGYAVRFGDCVPLYRETISAPVLGAGHYEPLRHYAEVHLHIEPLSRGSGIRYASECSLERLGKNDQNLILTMLREEEKKGVLVGAPLTDVKITLLSGATHLKHTEGGDLKEAACRALRQGLMKAKSVLLEPWCRFWVSVPVAMTGRVLSDLAAFGAALEAPVTDESGEMSEISGRAAAALLFEYPKQLAAFSGGTGSMRIASDGYEPCGETRTAEAMEQIPYRPEADLEHSPDSIFCSHGAGFLVHWDEADDYMHIS